MAEHHHLISELVRQTVFEPAPAARIRASPISPYESQPRQPIWEPAQPACMNSIYATLPPVVTLCGARNKQTNKDDAQLVIPIVASLKPCFGSEQGKSTTVA